MELPLLLFLLLPRQKIHTATAASSTPTLKHVKRGGVAHIKARLDDTKKAHQHTFQNDGAAQSSNDKNTRYITGLYF